jgi:hypothetical protein
MSRYLRNSKYHRQGVAHDNIDSVDVGKRLGATPASRLSLGRLVLLWPHCGGRDSAARTSALPGVDRRAGPAPLAKNARNFLLSCSSAAWSFTVPRIAQQRDSVLPDLHRTNANRCRPRLHLLRNDTALDDPCREPADDGREACRNQARGRRSRNCRSCRHDRPRSPVRPWRPGMGKVRGDWCRDFPTLSVSSTPSGSAT